MIIHSLRIYIIGFIVPQNLFMLVHQSWVSIYKKNHILYYVYIIIFSFLSADAFFNTSRFDVQINT